MEDKKHSGLGIASLVIAILSAFLAFFVVAMAGYIEVSTPGGMDPDSVEAFVIGAAIVTFIATSFVALCLGVAGIAQSDRKKIFPVLGLVFSLIAFGGTLSVVLYGMSQGCSLDSPSHTVSKHRQGG